MHLKLNAFIAITAIMHDDHQIDGRVKILKDILVVITRSTQKRFINSNFLSLQGSGTARKRRNLPKNGVVRCVLRDRHVQSLEALQQNRHDSRSDFTDVRILLTERKSISKAISIPRYLQDTYHGIHGLQDDFQPTKAFRYVCL